MSILRLKPGGRADTRLQVSIFSLSLLLVASGLCATNVHGFTVSGANGNQSVTVNRADLLQDGSSLSGGAEQTYAQGTISRTLSDFSQPLAINLTGTAPRAMSTRVIDGYYLAIQLSNAERSQCLQSSDFDVRLRVVAPVADMLSAVSGGDLLVTNLASTFDRSVGGSCPRSIRYGYILDLDVAGALSAGDYLGTVEASVEQIGPGITQTLQLTLEVNMPSVLVLYHPTQIDIDVQPSALAAALGADASCGTGYCMDAGNQSVTVSNLSLPVVLNIGASVPPLTTRTITLNDAVGARATGCGGGVYDTATYQILNPTGGIQTGNGVISGIQSSPCGLDLRTGDLAFDLDLNAIDSAINASATIQITIVGL